MKKIFFLLIFSYSLNSHSEDFCIINNILSIKKNEVRCQNNEILTGYFTFKSDISNLNYSKDNSFNLLIISKYKNEILNYLEEHCRKQGVRLKEIINLDKSDEKKYSVEVIITCRYR
tara:strand:+ start:275 stop:625 length:351 start_codon:yes stop_codon:yes gene_type:complete